MSIRRVVPNIASDRLDQNRSFYVDVLGFTVAMDMGWIVTLASPSNPTAQISVTSPDRSSRAHPNLTVEAADVDELHARVRERGLEIVYPLTDEPWGVRHFFAVDPNGLILNVMSHRRPPAAPALSGPVAQG